MCPTKVRSHSFIIMIVSALKRLRMKCMVNTWDFTCSKTSCVYTIVRIFWLSSLRKNKERTKFLTFATKASHSANIGSLVSGVLYSILFLFFSINYSMSEYLSIVSDILSHFWERFRQQFYAILCLHYPWLFRFLHNIFPYYISPGQCFVNLIMNLFNKRYNPVLFLYFTRIQFYLMLSLPYWSSL